MFKNLFRCINDDRIKINLTNKYVNIINYYEVLGYDDTNVIVNCKLFILNIKGTNLMIQRMLDNEIIVKGIIKSISFD